MINKEISQITQDDLQALIDNAVREGKDIEYKQLLPSDSPEDKKEFLADVSSFANAIGGDLIIGIVEDKGEPTEIKGVQVEDPDKEVLRLDSIINAGISRRIPAKEIQPVRLTKSGYVFIIRVLQSWISPHRVVFKGYDKFFSRDSAGKHPLDVDELRAAFNLSETLKERISNFKVDRISKIIADETPVACYEYPKIALHLIPLVSFNRPQDYGIEKVVNNLDILNRKMHPMGGHVANHRYNFDGFLTYTEGRDGKAISYFQLFRSGIIEAVDAGTIRRYDEKLLIPHILFEENIIKAVRDYLELYKVWNVAMPVFLFLTLIGIKGYTMSLFYEEFFLMKPSIIDRDVLQAPEIIIQDYDVKAESVLKPCFDPIWNACGHPSSRNYDEKGEWKPRR